VATVEGIGPARAAALGAIGITTKQTLLERGATPAGRAEIAEQSKISEKLITSWVSAVDLSRVKGIGAQYGELLQAAGVTTVGALAQQDAASLREQLVAVNTAKKLVRDVAGVSQIENWISQAKELPQAVTI
jgi:predicted flap endonuclease-1-like 5' DNA nuclease